MEPHEATLLADADDPEAIRDPRDRADEIARLAGSLAHEIRNPLSVMRLNLDLLAEDFQDPQTPRDRRVLAKIDRVRKEGHRLESLLEDFLRFVRVREPALAPADLNEVVDDMSIFCLDQANSAGVVIRTHLADDLPAVRLNVEMLKQALLNLILNALQFTAAGGELILATRREGDWAVVEITDTGAGIPDDVQPRVFDAFFSTRPGGSGLGLATTRRVVEAHGGTITLQSTPGKGSRFTIRLPIGGET
ncbi:MAG TPA: ATP-binding protein [Isosphaeraceae bacterium]|jgi:signal transduction histidine kinase|nr:ATP-binding protein [Isosphaeraceae bacterium]